MIGAAEWVDFVISTLVGVSLPDLSGSQGEALDSYPRMQMLRGNFLDGLRLVRKLSLILGWAIRILALSFFSAFLFPAVMVNGWAWLVVHRKLTSCLLM